MADTEGGRIIFEALTDITPGIAARSVSESECDSGKCSPVMIIIE